MYNYSARRKQGLGSLRPGYYLGGNITNYLLGNAINWGLGKGIDRLTKSKEQREEEAYKKTMQKLGIQPYFPDDDNDNNNDTTTSSGWKGGLMNLLATAFLGPLMGPIAMTVGRGLMNKSKGLGFMGGDGDGGSGIGPKVGPKTDYYTGSDEEDKDIENQITKDFSGIDSGGWDPGVAVTTTSAPSHIGPSNGDSGGGGASAGAGEAAHAGEEGSGWESSPFFKGGRVSYSKGGLASLWQR